MQAMTTRTMDNDGYDGGTTKRWMVVTVTAREDNMYIAEESTLAILPVCCLFLLLSFCYLPHAGYGGGTTTRRMVVTTTGREDKIAEECTLAILPVCCCLAFFKISLLSPTCWLWRRDNEEVDGGEDDGTRGQHCRRKYVGYTTCLLGFFNLFVVSHMLEGQRIGGWW